MVTSGNTVRRRPKDRKEQILVAARDLIVEFGYRNVSMAQLAERVGITAGALYRHFANKSVLLYAVIARGIDDVLPFPEPDATLADIVAVAAESAVAHRYLGALWVRESRNLPDPDRHALTELLREVNKSYARAIRSDRPDLSEQEAVRLGWGVQSVFASTSFHTTKVSDAEFARLLTSSALALCRVELTPEHAGAARGPGLVPVSKRERLLSHAITLFERRGYGATGLDDIGAAVGVTGPNLYGYFDSKADIIAAASERGTSALWLVLHAALRENDDPATALRQIVDGYAGLAVRRTIPTSMLLTEQSLSDEPTRARQREVVAEWVALLRAARPDADETSARVRVHTALGVIHILSGIEPVRDESSTAANLAAMASAVLFAD